MPTRSLNKLSDVKVKAAKKTGRHSDGGGLYLNVSPTGTKSWLFMWVVAGKRREMGMGAYPAVSLSDARKKAEANRSTLEAGGDPIAERSKEAEPTFGECADQFLASMQGQWRNEKHRAQWKMTLESYATTIRFKRVSLVSTDDILKVLTPIWREKPETASRLRGRLERVLDFAKAKGWRSGENPALWRGHLKSILPARQKLTRGHHAALPYQEVPAFVARLRGLEALAARALEFTILTAARSGETLGATWGEMDMEKAVWTVPARRMKAGKEHRVPLTAGALAILKPLNEARVSDFVFPGQRKGRPLSGMAMEMLLRRMDMEVTTHGMRSGFRDWCGDATNFPRDLAEQALAHKVGDATEQAYRRSTALDKRRKMMEAWNAFCDRPESGKVVQLRRQ